MNQHLNIELITNELSDHNGLIKICTLANTNGTTVPIVTVNLLTICKVGNNGFRKTETHVEYKNRLQALAVKLENDVSTHYPAAIFCFQEFPTNESDQKIISQTLNLEIISSKTGTHDFHQAIGYPKSFYSENKAQKAKPLMALH